MHKIEIMDLTVVCRNFPNSPVPEIHREHLLDTIDKIFNGDTAVLVVEGKDGIGKTTLLSQYAKRYRNNACSLFINPASHIACAPEYLKLNLIEQIHWILNKSIIDPDVIDDSYVGTLIHKLQRHGQKLREKYYFIIDGLDDAEDIHPRIKDTIFKDILPLGLSGFKFLISGEINNISSCMHKSVTCKSFPLSAFSLDESEKYLNDLQLNREEIEDLHKMCRGIPSHLASVRRILTSGTNIQNILSEDPGNLLDFLAIEWNQIGILSENQMKLLAVIAYARKKYSVDELSILLSIDREEINNYTKNLGIIYIDSKTNEINFVSEAHRQYTAKQLSRLKDEVTNLLINNLLKDQHSMKFPRFLGHSVRLGHHSLQLI